MKEHPGADSDTERDFFSRKRPWSRIKDQILGQYMRPYLSKVSTLGKRIILIDAFAGPGRFEDGSAGSPLIMCQAAEKCVPSGYLAIFVNSEKKHHDQLSKVLSRFIEQKKVLAIHGTAEQLLDSVRCVITDDTVFLYLDPFALTGCEFSIYEPFIRRDQAYSTEIVVTLSIPTMHRLAARIAVAAGKADDPLIRSFHGRLTKVLGGEYWKPVFLDDLRPPEAKAEGIMAMYRQKILDLHQYPGYSGSCPVREKEGSGIKYYVTFYSRHPDAMLLMNDAMCAAYQNRMHEAATENTLFAGTSWKDTRPMRSIEDTILEAAQLTAPTSRFELWVDIVQRYFMRFTGPEYRKAVSKLVREEKLIAEDIRGTGRLNDDSRLYYGC